MLIRSRARWCLSCSFIVECEDILNEVKGKCTGLLGREGVCFLYCRCGMCGRRVFDSVGRVRCFPTVFPMGIPRLGEIYGTERGMEPNVRSWQRAIVIVVLRQVRSRTTCLRTPHCISKFTQVLNITHALTITQIASICCSGYHISTRIYIHIHIHIHIALPFPNPFSHPSLPSI